MPRWIGLCFCLLLSLNVSAINAVVSHAIFYAYQPGKPVLPYAETYWQIDPSSIHYAQQADSSWSARLKTDIVFTYEDGTQVEDHFILKTAPKASYQQAFHQTILDLRRYTLRPGKIALSMRITEELFPDKVFNFSKNFVIDTIPSGPYYSNIQVLDTAYDGDGNSVFHKNGKVQIPLSTNFLDDHRNTLHLYTELYSTSTLDTSLAPFVQRVFISRKPNGSPLLGIVQKDTIKPATVIPFIGRFNISSLSSGNYYVNAILEKIQGVVVAQQSTFFQRSNKNPQTAQDSAAADSAEQNITYIDLNSTFIAKYSFAQVRAILKMMLPVVSPNEASIIYGFLKRPDETYMRYFIYNFWKDQNPKDPKKAWDEYTAKVKDVNKLFGYGHLPGYETERGIVYLKYGKPTERIVVENEQGSLPYELWQYNATAKQGSGSFFIFYRPRNMINDFTLLHSTVPGEIRTTQWRQILYTNGSNPSARAEQFNIR